MSDSEIEPFSTEELQDCPLCGSADWAPWAEARDSLMRRSDRVFNYARCRACDVLFEQARPTEESAGYFYEGDYGPYRLGKRRKSPWRFARKWATRVAERLSGEKAAARVVAQRRAAQLRKPNAAVLDFGAGGGRFLDSSKAAYGCRTVAMDFNPALFESLRARGHDVASATPEGWASHAAESFDLVVMNHVLEHVYHPRDVLANVHRVLKRDGVLDIAVPNPDGYSAKTYGPNWFSLDSPRHVMLFSPAVAERLLRECGFGDMEIVADPVIRDALRSAARALGEDGERIVENNIMLPIETAQRIQREVVAGAYDRFHVFARKA